MKERLQHRAMNRFTGFHGDGPHSNRPSPRSNPFFSTYPTSPVLKNPSLRPPTRSEPRTFRPPKWGYGRFGSETDLAPKRCRISGYRILVDNRQAPNGHSTPKLPIAAGPRAGKMVMCEKPARARKRPPKGKGPWWKSRRKTAGCTQHGSGYKLSPASPAVNARPKTTHSTKGRPRARIFFHYPRQNSLQGLDHLPPNFRRAVEGTLAP